VWHNPRLLNAVADALYLAAAGVLFWLAVEAGRRAPFLPVRTVALTGDLQHVDAATVRARLEGRIFGNFFGVELADVRRELEQLPWVRRVVVRREWPDRLVVRIESHVTLARWSDGRLVNRFGELFRADPGDAELPRLGGPPGSEREVTRRYLAFRDLLAPLGAEPAQVLLSARRAWQVKLGGPEHAGLQLELGRDQARQSLEERLARFVAAYPRTAVQLNQRSAYVDLRYPNGFAIRVPEAADEGRNTARKRT